MPARPAPGAATLGLCLGYGHIWPKIKVVRPAKIFFEARNITLSDDEILTNAFLRVNRGTLQMRIAAGVRAYVRV